MRKRLLILATALALLVPAASAEAGLSGGLVGQGSLPGGICSPCPAPSGTNQPAITGGGITTLPAPPQPVASKKARDRFKRCQRKGGPRICGHGLQGGAPPDTWLAVAAAYWGVTATCPPSTVHLIWDQALLDNTPVGRVFGMANIGACWAPGAERNIWLNPYFRDNQHGTFTDGFWCRVVTHEYGHLIGLYHYQSDQYPIMGPNLPNVPVPGC